jgi:hypothetical protein
MDFQLTVTQGHPAQPGGMQIGVSRLDPVKPGETLEQTTEQMVTFLQQVVLQMQNTLETLKTKPTP